MHRSKPQLIVDYPFVVCRIKCRMCVRRGQYRLARLAQKYGADTSLAHMLHLLTIDCPWNTDRRKPQKYAKGCGAFLPDIEGPPRPPDLPPALGGLVPIEGGKKAAGGKG
ncbi:hypothetical protein GCM10007989_25390 [Devosia pacifica]|uniref:Uncharacterized protein n=1 Tax=Devosia pacifica TaxID=1335967 RepID=A0A918VVK6_9HYPH|nr:hypothetical protein [Devosia pacifica]GHA28268.1 hypothetical protein GCM10007989_25390 [Devosia pacifica]